jgi:hypothetical protein
MWLVGVGVLAFVVAIGAAIFGPRHVPTNGSNSFSVSAIGHQALLDGLRRAGASVSVSRFQTETKLSSQTLLIVAEPDQQFFKLAAKLVTAGSAGRILLVLPKWNGSTHPSKDHWIGTADWYRQGDLEGLLAAIAVGGGVQRPSSTSGWRIAGGLDIPSLGPTLEAPQLIISNRIRPIIGTDAGVLLGEVTGSDGRIWILADPDLLSNRGIGQGENADLVGAIVTAALPADGTIIIDETTHGFEVKPNIWRSLFEMPLLVATLFALLAVSLLAWAAVGRFGAPERAESALRAGKEELIGNMAKLLQVGGHGMVMLRRYNDHARREVARALHVPKELDAIETEVWLDRVGGSRHVGQRISDISRELDRLGQHDGRDSGRMVRLAERIHQWKREMLHGSG